MDYPRWIIAETGEPEDGVCISHHIQEYNPKNRAYFTLASVYSLGAAEIIMEALYWQENLQKGLLPAPEPQPARGKAKKPKATSKRIYS